MYYIKISSENIIIDILKYPHEDYEPVEVDKLPLNVSGGWYKLEGGVIVEYPELKPVDKDEEISDLKERLDATEQMLLQIMMEGVM